MAEPPALWHATAPPLPPFPPLRGPEEADLLVIGGGFAGLSTALHAAEAGLSVMLTEAERIAWGASGRNAGFVVPNFAKVNPDAVRTQLGPDQGGRLLAMAGGSADLVFSLITRHSIAADAVQGGWLEPSHCEATLERARMRAAQWAALGRPTEALDAAQVERITGVKGWLGGWTDRSGGTLNPVGFARGLANAAAGAGARLFEDTAVTQLTPHGSGWEAKTAAGSIIAKRVVIATNAHAGSLWPGLSRSFFPLRVFQIATEPLPEDVRRRYLANGRCVSDSRRNLFTFRFDPDNRLITGGMHVVSVGAATRVPRRILARMARMLELGATPKLSHAWSGLAAVTPNFLPRAVELAPGVIAGFACNGRGIAMTTAMGRELGGWAAGLPPRALGLPFVPLAAIPFHGLARLAPNLLLPQSMLRDRLERAPNLPP